MAWVRLEEAYTLVARRLAPEVSERTVVAAGDVGALGYFLDAHILDLVGLNSKEVMQYYPLPDEMYVINYAVPPGAVFAAMPDYVVLLEVYGRETVLKDPRFLHAYTLVATVPTDLYGSRGLLVFRRMDPP